MKVDKFKRYQNGLSIVQMFPIRTDKVCACGCGEKLQGRRSRWANDDCRQKSLVEFLIIKGDTQVIRCQISIRERDKYGGLFCHKCGEDLNKLCEDWHADHILEVQHGGGGCGLDNFQPLCQKCHKQKTFLNR